MHVDRIDHFVLTGVDIEKTCAFYAALGMKIVEFREGRKALSFGGQKINLHLKGREFEPKALNPACGASDFCLTTTPPLDDVIAHLRSKGIDVESCPIRRTGARSALLSIYLRDPDGSLVEIGNEKEPAAAGV